MKCPKCKTETKHGGTSQTLVGYQSPPGHDHDDNCKKRFYECEGCGYIWMESRKNRCPVIGCGWVGKEECFCHKGKKVDEWTDPDDYCITREERLERFKKGLF